ncbi:MAG TPA: arylesterase [Nitrospirales bacterium]|nr:arylesterase [Nitrospirales bacterium]
MLARYLGRLNIISWFAFASLACIIGSLAACDQQASLIGDRSTTDSPIDATRSVVETETAPVIVAFGDSLTAGLGVASPQTYPAQLQNKISQAGFSHRVVNMGVNGETTAGALRRLDHIMELRPSIVILEFGANDGLRGLAVDQTQANLAQIIGRLRARDIMVVLTGMRLPPNYGPSYTRSFAQIFPALATMYHIPFMPFFLQDVATKPALNQPDGLHPTATGYSIIVDNLWPILFPILKPGGDSTAILGESRTKWDEQ